MGFRTLLREGDDSGKASALKRLLSESLRLHATGYLVAVGAMVVMAASTSMLAWMLRDLVNGMFQNRDIRLSIMFALSVMGVFFLRGVATYVSNVILARIGNAIVARQQVRIFDHLLAQGVDFYNSNMSADLVTRVTHNAQAARDAIQTLVTTIGRDLLTVIGLLAVMIISDPLMFVVSGLFIPFAAYGINTLRKRVRRLTQSEMSSIGAMVNVVQETVQGVRIVKSFAMEEKMRERMLATIEGVRQRSDKIATLQARTSPIMETLGGVAIATAIVYGAWRVIYFAQDPGAFVAFIGALMLAYDPGKRLARLGVEIERGLTGVQLMYELLDTATTMTEKPDAKALAVKGGKVAFQKVTFAYKTDHPVLTDLSFVAEAGKTTALVGPSGGGKSTIIALVQRFFDVNGGHILIDGQDVRDVTYASLRAAMAFVSQDVFLFQGTIHDNIAVGRPGASETEIVAAARAAYAHDFIMGLPDGYDTLIGEHGTGLSGGQRQRVAIARAIVRNAPIMLLDEATSALDSESEFEVQRALDQMMVGRTSLIIAHRLSTIMRADKIVVIEGGRVVETGNHAELIAKNGRYAHYVALQFGEGDEAEARGAQSH